MMIRNISIGLITFLMMWITTNLSAQELKINFTTTQISGGHYSPNHILAIWITDSNNNYVKTLMVYANKRKSYLYKWNSISGGNTTDAVTGSTLSSFKEYSLIWDLKDYKDAEIPAGTYKLCMEMTSDNKQGPYREIEFSTGGANYTTNPGDGQNFKNIVLAYTGTQTSIKTDFATERYLKLYPNPSKGLFTAIINLDQESETEISIYDIQNRLILRKVIQLTKGQNTINLHDDLQQIASGIYLFLVKTNEYTIGDKLIISNSH